MGSYFGSCLIALVLHIWLKRIHAAITAATQPASIEGE